MVVPSNKILTHKERLFVRAFVICWNGAEAVRQAGYKCKAPQEQGYSLLCKPHIKDLVKKELEDRYAKMDITASKVIAAFAEQAFTPIEASPVWKIQFERVEREAKIEKGINKNLPTMDASMDILRRIERDGIARQVKALEMLGKHLKMFQDVTINNTQVNISAPQMAPLTTLELVALAKSQIGSKSLEEGELVEESVEDAQVTPDPSTP